MCVVAVKRRELVERCKRPQRERETRETRETNQVNEMRCLCVEENSSRCPENQTTESCNVMLVQRGRKPNREQTSVYCKPYAGGVVQWRCAVSNGVPATVASAWCGERVGMWQCEVRSVVV